MKEVLTNSIAQKWNFLNPKWSLEATADRQMAYWGALRGGLVKTSLLAFQCQENPHWALEEEKFESRHMDPGFFLKSSYRALSWYVYLPQTSPSLIGIFPLKEGKIFNPGDLSPTWTGRSGWQKQHMDSKTLKSIFLSQWTKRIKLYLPWKKNCTAYGDADTIGVLYHSYEQ